VRKALASPAEDADDGETDETNADEGDDQTAETDESEPNADADARDHEPDDDEDHSGTEPLDHACADLLAALGRATESLASMFTGNYDFEALTPRDREALQPLQKKFVTNLKAMADRFQVITTALKSQGDQASNTEPETRPTP
jgi:hypothetical protein